MSLTPEQVEDIAVVAASRAARDAAHAAVEEAAKKAAEQAAQKASMTKEEASTLVAEAVRQTLLQLGVDSTNPLEMQRDFQHLRQWRRAGEDLRGKGMFVLMSIFISGLVGLIVVGIKEWFGK